MLHIKFQALLSQVVLKKIFEYFSMYFYGSNPEHPDMGSFYTWGRGATFMLHTIFQAPESSGSKEDF